MRTESVAAAKRSAAGGVGVTQTMVGVAVGVGGATVAVMTPVGVAAQYQGRSANRPETKQPYRGRATDTGGNGFARFDHPSATAKTRCSVSGVLLTLMAVMAVAILFFLERGALHVASAMI
jgi:hypothetical protein